ncbi:phage tail protein [Mesorhizobium muleiense]|uniref:phage tail protein n=1 Tax=Mesorhizobium muleiense TaxID=1004279 RepID=UPI001F308D3E|nr:phage tail protein [Mesorhizobium muleiense]MCF6112008.1 phage tail protein [Mesorhizobium muleiense]
MRPRLNELACFETGIHFETRKPPAKMPGVIEGIVFAILTSNALTFGLAGSAFAISAITTGISLALSIGLQLALSQKPPAAPKASDIQTNIRQPISPRRRIYGRFLTGSVVVFGFRRGEKSYILHYICEGPIEGYVSFRLDKRPVTLNAEGFVTDAQYFAKGRERVQILTTLGLADDEPFQEILDVFPELDDPLKPFRHRGCAMVLQIVEQVPQDKIARVYPNNMPSLQVVIDALNTIYDPRDNSTGLTDNCGLCLLAETMDVYGLTAADDEDVAFDAFAAFADHCDDDIDTKAGGAEKRYRAAGVIQMNAENEERIKALATACNADVFLDSQGRISVRQKLRSTPGIALRASNGDHLSVQLEGGRTEQKKFNTVKISYVDPDLNYKENEVTWRHAGHLDDDGVPLVETLAASLCPSASQAQRLGKLYLHEQNPEFVGSLTSGPQALDLLEDYAFTLDLSPEDAFERVACASGDIQYDAESMTVSASVVVFAEDATAWVPAIDEQDQVEIPPVLNSNVDDVTLDVTVTVELLNNSAPILKFSWVAAGASALPDSYRQEVQVSPEGADDWSDATVSMEQDTAQYGPVADGGAYDWRIRNVAAGDTFDYQNSVTPVTVVVDTTPPVALLTFSASDGTGQFVAGFGTANDSHLANVAIYKVAAGGVLNRVTDLVAPPYAVAPGISYALPIVSAPGSFDIYAEPFNRSSIAGPLGGPDGAVVS